MNQASTIRNAMSGTISGVGPVRIAINYGYYRYKTLAMVAAVTFLAILVQPIQSMCARPAIKLVKKNKCNYRLYL